MTRKILVPLAILAVGVLGVVGLVASRPEAVVESPELSVPLVRVQTVQPAPVDFKVRAHGTVAPRTESDLVPQVAGPVVWVSPALASGGFFEADEPLVRIDRADYEVELESARAAVARRKSEYARASKEMTRQSTLSNQSVASASRLDEANNMERVASASLREAEAKLSRALRDVERTEIEAPYRGRVRSQQVGVGQFVNRGSAIARIYAVDFAEVRLPIPDIELHYLDLASLYQGDGSGAPRSRVTLRAQFAGAEYTWEGEIVRTEGEIDPKSRMVHVVARVADPYMRDAPGSLEVLVKPPLAVGLFVDAEIDGRRHERAVVLPRSALREGDVVHVIDAEGTLHLRNVDVLRRERNRVVVGRGLDEGDRVSISRLRGAVEGMKVRTVEGEPTRLGDGGEAGGEDPRS